MIRALLAYFVAPVVISACATVEPDPLAAREAPLQVYLADDASALAYANSLSACDGTQDHAIRDRGPSEGVIRPTRVLTCIPNYPDILEATGFEARCETAFDIAANGEPINLVTDCRTWNDGMIDNPERFEARAKLVFETMATRAVTGARYLPLNDDLPGAKRDGLVQPIRFEYADNLAGTLERSNQNTDGAAAK